MSCWSKKDYISYVLGVTGILYGVHRQISMSHDNPLDFLLASLVIQFVLFACCFYINFVNKKHAILTSDFFQIMRAGSTACFTSHLFAKQQIFYQLWNYWPLMVFVTLSILYVLQQGTMCDRSYMQIFIFINMIAQVYVGCAINNWLLGTAAFSLCLGHYLFQGGNWFLHMAPDSCYNLLTGLYCASCTGQRIELPLIDKYLPGTAA